MQVLAVNTGALSGGRGQRVRERATQRPERYGYGKAIVLARFIAIVRTAPNPFAGIVGGSGADLRALAGSGRSAGTVEMITAGSALGSPVPNLDTYLLPIFAVVVLLSLNPLMIEVFRSRRAERAS